MGLDNGIVLKTKAKISHISLPKVIKEDWLNKDYDKSIEVCYWRKCWGIRNEIIYDILQINEEALYDYSLTIENINDIIDILKKYAYNKKYYEDNARSIWEFEEYNDKLKEDIKRIKWLKRYMKYHKGNIEKVTFYDSY
jgi:hypothetical protein